MILPKGHLLPADSLIHSFARDKSIVSLKKTVLNDIKFVLQYIAMETQLVNTEANFTIFVLADDSSLTH